MKEYYIVNISAETQKQADTILDSLLSKKLVTGGQFIHAPARFLWRGEIVNMEYITITSYTTGLQKEAVIKDIRETSTEEVPMITFVQPDDLNQELKNWINETLQ
jgi:uncharacterized protein involved in tolerance to divalent cations